jgi:hypothetical protein
MSLLIALDLRAPGAHKRKLPAVKSADDGEEGFERINVLLRPLAFEASPNTRRVLRSMSPERRAQWERAHARR